MRTKLEREGESRLAMRMGLSEGEAVICQDFQFGEGVRPNLGDVSSFSGFISYIFNSKIL